MSAKRISAPIVDDEEESDDFADTPKAKPRARAPAKKAVAEHDVESISEGAYARARGAQGVMYRMFADLSRRLSARPHRQRPCRKDS